MIMDYEKLHKDTIVKLQEMVNSGKITVETARGICADFVPKSEDERIMEELIEHIRKEKERFNDAPNVQRKYELWIDWLERQGENEPDNKIKPKFKVGDKIKFAKEPKYPVSEIIAIKNDAYYFGEALYLPFIQQDEWELVGQNPTWGEDDDSIIEKLLCRLDNEQDNYPLLSCDFEEIEEIKDKLKSIKDRYIWKPSKEQINALKDAIRIVTPCGQYGELNYLLSDLQKL